MRQKQMHPIEPSTLLPLNIYPKRHQRLISILSKQRSLSLSEQNNLQSADKKLKRNWNSTEDSSKQNQQKAQTCQFGRTNFMISYMDRLKKQRKRQEKKKINCNLLKRENKNGEDSMYIFLPNVLKVQQNQQELKINKKKQEIMLTTINLFESKNKHSSKVRSFSFDQRAGMSGNKKKLQQSSYQMKMRQIIQQIKSSRQKSNKYLSVVDDKTNKIYYFQNMAQAMERKILDEPASATERESVGLLNGAFTKKKANLNDKSQKNKLNRMPTLSNRQLQPWSSHQQQLGFHEPSGLSDHVGIEGFNFY